MEEFALLGTGITRIPYLNAKKLLDKGAMSPTVFLIVYYSDGNSIRSVLIEYGDLLLHEEFFKCLDAALGREYNVWFNFVAMRKYMDMLGLSETFGKLVPFGQ